MKIIFLDIDGVLNSIGWVERTKGTAYEDKEIDPSKVRLLKQIIDKTDAKIVLSSTWREVNGSDDIPRHQMYDYLVEEFKRLAVYCDKYCGIPSEFEDGDLLESGAYYKLKMKVDA